jgi:hypothetical protein
MSHDILSRIVVDLYPSLFREKQDLTPGCLWSLKPAGPDLSPVRISDSWASTTDHLNFTLLRSASPFLYVKRGLVVFWPGHLPIV